jgi:hypothetical protein
MSNEIENVTISLYNLYQNDPDWISKLEQIYDPDIRFNDLERSLTGRDQVISYYQSILSLVDLNILSVVSNRTTVFTEFTIGRTGFPEDRMTLLSLQHFNQDNKIIKIEVYDPSKTIPEDVVWQKKLAEYRKRDPFIYN